MVSQFLARLCRIMNKLSASSIATVVFCLAIVSSCQSGKVISKYVDLDSQRRRAVYDEILRVSHDDSVLVVVAGYADRDSSQTSDRSHAYASGMTSDTLSLRIGSIRLDTLYGYGIQRASSGIGNDRDSGKPIRIALSSVESITCEPSRSESRFGTYFSLALWHIGFLFMAVLLWSLLGHVGVFVSVGAVMLIAVLLKTSDNESGNDEESFGGSSTLLSALFAIATAYLTAQLVGRANGIALFVQGIIAAVTATITRKRSQRYVWRFKK